jgi:hypothetical protein
MIVFTGGEMGAQRESLLWLRGVVWLGETKGFPTRGWALA